MYVLTKDEPTQMEQKFHDSQSRETVKIWSCVPRDSEPRMSVLARASSNLPNADANADPLPKYKNMI
jgi:hypothetical protein